MKNNLLRISVVLMVAVALLGFTTINSLAGEKQTEEKKATLVKKIAEKKELEGKKVVMIIAEDQFRDEELLEPKKLLAEAGAEVVVASTTLKKVKGMLEAEVIPDTLVNKLKAKDWDAIVMVGGLGAQQYWEDSTVYSLLKEADKEGKVIGAICIAPVTLANCGLLKDKKATVWPSVEKNLRAKGALCTGKGVEKDKNIITANGPKSAKEFGLTLIEALKEKPKEEKKVKSKE